MLRIGFYGLWIPLAILAPQIVVLEVLFSAMWLAGTGIDPVNLVVAALVIGLGVNYGVYVAAAARERGEVSAAVLHGGRALAVTALTTVAGFGFLVLSRYPSLASLGILSALGLTLSLAASLTLLPAFLRAAETRTRAGSGHRDLRSLRFARRDTAGAGGRFRGVAGTLTNVAGRRGGVKSGLEKSRTPANRTPSLLIFCSNSCSQRARSRTTGRRVTVPIARLRPVCGASRSNISLSML